MRPDIVPFDLKKNIKKGVVHLATYLVGLGAAWIASHAHGFALTPEQQSWLIVGLTGIISSGLTMLRNRLKMRWPDVFGWL